MNKIKKILKGIRGKQILVAILALMVVASGYYRWITVRTPKTVPASGDVLPVEELETSAEPTAVDETDYFALARYERDCARSEAVEILSVSADADSDGALAKKIEKHAEYAENETAIENMVKSKGYADCVAFVEDSGVRVIVKSEDLDETGVAQIMDIAVECTGVSPTDIRISNKN